MARISSVVIRRFKRIAEIEIPLDDVTLLIGANNSGKSSVLQAIHFAVSIAQTADLVGEGISWRNDKFELSFNPSQLLYSPVGDVLSLATGGLLQEPRQTQIEIEFRDTENQTCIVGLRGLQGAWRDHHSRCPGPGRVCSAQAAARRATRSRG